MDGSLDRGVGNTAPELLQRIQELERRLASAEADNRKKDEELEQAYHRAGQATEEVELGKQEIQRLAQNLEHVQMHCELEMHRKVEALRQEHAEQLKYERCQWERERTRADGWLEEVKSKFELEKVQYEMRIQSLESDLALAKRYSPDRELEYKHASEERDPGLHSIVHPESVPQPQLGTKPFCLKSHGPVFVPCNEHNDVVESQSLVDDSCNPIHVSGNADLQPMVGRHDLVQLHNLFTQSLDSIADTEQLQHVDTKCVQRQVPVGKTIRNTNAMANTNTNLNATSANTNLNAYANTNTNAGNVNPNLGQSDNVDITAAATNVGHIATTATTRVTGTNTITATEMVQTQGPPPLLPMKESFGTITTTYYPCHPYHSKRPD